MPLPNTAVNQGTVALSRQDKIVWEKMTNIDQKKRTKVVRDESNNGARGTTGAVVQRERTRGVGSMQSVHISSSVIPNEHTNTHPPSHPTRREHVSSAGGLADRLAHVVSK